MLLLYVIVINCMLSAATCHVLWTHKKT